MLYFIPRDGTAFTEVREHLEEFTEMERIDYDYTRVQSEDLEEIAGVGAADAFKNAPLRETETNRGEDADGEGTSDSDEEAPDTTGDGEGIDGRPPVVVEETGLFVDGLGGFPGPYTGYVEDTLGAEGVWDLVEELDDRRGVYRTGVAYADADRVITFESTCTGEVVAPRGPSDAGLDRLFEVEEKTFAEMSVGQKNSVSSRSRAMTKLADWLVS